MLASELSSEDKHSSKLFFENLQILKQDDLISRKKHIEIGI